MSSQYHRNRLSVLSAVAKLGTPTSRELSIATGLSVFQVNRALVHRWFEVAAPVEHPKRYRLTAAGRAAETAAREGTVPS